MKRIEFKIDEKDILTGVDTISIVKDPAIESNFVTLSKQKPEYIEMKGAYKQVLAGLALIPDKDIPRVSPKGEKFMAYFTKDGIEAIRNRFHKLLMNNKVNINHSETDYIDAYMIESFIIDSEQRLEDVKQKGIENPVMGSWFVAYKIEDKQVFEQALSGEFKGFSVEMFIKSAFEKPAETSENIEDAVANMLNKISEQITLNFSNKQEKFEKPDKWKRRLTIINHELNQI